MEAEKNNIKGPIIIGAGPSGLASAACLHELGLPSLVLEKSSCIASLWQLRTYDRLKLHVPKKYCQLPLLGFPSHYPKYPTKSQFVSYMKYYASHFSISPHFNEEVHSAQYDDSSKKWTVRTNRDVYASKWVIVATGENGEPNIPQIKGMGEFKGRILHTCGYNSGKEFENQRVLVVGCGNSGMEVSLDLCDYNAAPHIVVRSSVHVLPREMFGMSTFGLSLWLMKWLPLKVVDMVLLLVANVVFGRTHKLGIRRPKQGPLQLKLAEGKTPVLDVGALSEIKAGKIKVMAAVKEIQNNEVKFADGHVAEFDSILLATGYKRHVPTWLKGCHFSTGKEVPGWREKNGLYAVGFTNMGLLGASSDAVKIAQDIASQWDEGTTPV